MKYYFKALPAIILSVILIHIPPVSASDTILLSGGQTVYVPVYSHIYFGNKERPFLLTVTLSIRNTDPDNKIVLTAVDYYETQGKLIKHYLDRPIILGPLHSVRYIVPEKEKIGGSGANFMVDWNADRAVSPPIIESIMIGAKSGQGISFTSRGQAVRSRPK